MFEYNNKYYIKKHSKNKDGGNEFSHQMSIATNNDDGYALCTSSHTRDSIWFMDFICFHHIYLFRKMFCLYELKSNVLMRNDQHCKIVSIGSIRSDYLMNCPYIDKYMTYF